MADPSSNEGTKTREQLVLELEVLQKTLQVQQMEMTVQELQNENAQLLEFTKAFELLSDEYKKGKAIISGLNFQLEEKSREAARTREELYTSQAQGNDMVREDQQTIEKLVDGLKQAETMIQTLLEQRQLLEAEKDAMAAQYIDMLAGAEEGFRRLMSERNVVTEDHARILLQLHRHERAESGLLHRSQFNMIQAQAALTDAMRIKLLAHLLPNCMKLDGTGSTLVLNHPHDILTSNLKRSLPSIHSLALKLIPGGRGGDAESAVLDAMFPANGLLNDDSSLGLLLHHCWFFDHGFVLMQVIAASILGQLFYKYNIHYQARTDSQSVSGEHVDLRTRPTVPAIDSNEKRADAAKAKELFTICATIAKIAIYFYALHRSLTRINTDEATTLLLLSFLNDNSQLLHNAMTQLMKIYRAIALQRQVSHFTATGPLQELADLLCSADSSFQTLLTAGLDHRDVEPNLGDAFPMLVLQWTLAASLFARGTIVHCCEDFPTPSDRTEAIATAESLLGRFSPCIEGMMLEPEVESVNASTSSHQGLSSMHDIIDHSLLRPLDPDAMWSRMLGYTTVAVPQSMLTSFLESRPGHDGRAPSSLVFYSTAIEELLFTIRSKISEQTLSIDVMETLTSRYRQIQPLFSELDSLAGISREHPIANVYLAKILFGETPHDAAQALGTAVMSNEDQPPFETTTSITGTVPLLSGASRSVDFSAVSMRPIGGPAMINLEREWREEIKELNGRLYDVQEENKTLKTQLEKLHATEQGESVPGVNPTQRDVQVEAQLNAYRDGLQKLRQSEGALKQQLETASHNAEEAKTKADELEVLLRVAKDDLDRLQIPVGSAALWQLNGDLKRSMTLLNARLADAQAENARLILAGLPELGGAGLRCSPTYTGRWTEQLSSPGIDVFSIGSIRPFSVDGDDSFEGTQRLKIQLAKLKKYIEPSKVKPMTS